MNFLLLERVAKRLAKIVGQGIVQILSLKVVLPAVPKQRVQPAKTDKTRSLDFLRSIIGRLDAASTGDRVHKHNRR